MSFWTKEGLRLSQTESGKSTMDITSQEKLHKVQSPAMPTLLYEEKKLREGGVGGGWSKWKLRIENCVFATANSQL